MDSVVDKHKMLIETLYDKTLVGRVPWRYEQTIDYLAALVGGHHIELEEIKNQNQEPVYKVNLRTNGEVVDWFTDEIFAGLTPITSPHMNYFDLMKELREVAFRQATGADKVIDEILTGLDGI